jgi:hypothetical protein
MSRMVPSQAVAVIARLFPHADPSSSQAKNINWTNAHVVAAVLAVADAVPNELLTVDDKTFAEFVEARAVIAGFIDNSHAHGSTCGPLSDKYIRAIRQILEQCPDQVIPANIQSLSFVSDADLRETLRSDIAEVERALIEGEWKSATVMAGSVIEALLLSALNQLPNAKQVGAQLPQNPAKGPLENWDLYHYIEVAQSLNVIKDETAAQLRLAKDFRNLIHPGRAKRLATKCDRATARAAAAGVDFVIRDLTP